MKYVDIYIALYDYTAQNEEELSFQKDESLYILDKDNSDWYKAQTIHRQSGYIPTNYIEKKNPTGLVQALFDYEANAAEELNFKKDQQMILYEKEEESWYLVATLDFTFGLVPHNYLKSIPCPAVALYPFQPTAPEETQLVPDQSVLVLDYEDPDWWKIESMSTVRCQGLVPSQYLRLVPPHAGKPLPGRRAEQAKRQAEATEKRKEERRKEREAEERRKEREAEERRKEREAEERRKEREAEEKRKEREAEEREAEEREAEEREAEEREARKREAEREELENRRAAQQRAEEEKKSRQQRESKERQRRPMHDSYQHVQRFDPLLTPNPASVSFSGPNPARVRQWTDSTGEFKVEAALMSCSEGKVRLFKTNGVKIEVPMGKMCAEDLAYLEHETGQTLVPTPRAKFCWLGYFRQLNIPYETAADYAQTFEANGLTEHDLVQKLTPMDLTLLGMTENHVQQLQCLIASCQVKPASEDASHGVGSLQDQLFFQPYEESRQRQIRKDEQLARQLQEEDRLWQPTSASAVQTPRTQPAMWEPPPQLPQRPLSHAHPPPMYHTDPPPIWMSSSGPRWTTPGHRSPPQDPFQGMDRSSSRH